VEQGERVRGGSRALTCTPSGSLPMHLHTVYMAYSECFPTRLNPLAERTCFSQVAKAKTIFKEADASGDEQVDAEEFFAYLSMEEAKEAPVSVLGRSGSSIDSKESEPVDTRSTLDDKARKRSASVGRLQK
jgi:hypothetical protein